MKNTLRVLLCPVLLLLLCTCNRMNLKEKCCDDSHYKQQVPDQNLSLFVPNVMTPNGDQYNDAFVYGASYKIQPAPGSPQFPVFTVRKLKVYRLNGTRPVFESNDYQNDFTGRSASGKELAEGRYRYVLTLDDNTVEGRLCLIRSKEICTDRCRAINPEDPALDAASCN